MIRAIGRIRSEGYKTAALTNNWVYDSGPPERMGATAEAFDVMIESCRVGLRKPDPEIYREACRELGIAPEEAVFLDDIGRNLKPARKMGMTTIKVDSPEQAINDLEAVLGVRLLDE